MLQSFLTGLMAIASIGTPTAITEPRIVGVSVFTNNFAVVVRELQVDASGVVRFTKIPKARLGTLWVGSRGTTVLGAVRSVEEVEGEPVLVGDWFELINKNVGKTATLIFDRQGMRPVTGTLLGVATGLVYIQVRGTTHTYLGSNVRSVQLSGADLQLRSTSKEQWEVVTIRTSGAGTVYVSAVEQGMKWTPSYRIDISDPKRLEIVGQATISNDLASFENVPVKLVSGFPSLRYLSQLDPFTAPSQAQVPSRGIGGGRGFGAAPPAAEERRWGPDAAVSEGFDTPIGEGEQIGDIFFYTLRPISLKNEQRGLYIFLNTTTDYRQLFTVAVPNFVGPQGNFVMDQATLGAWRSLVFKNNTTEPWTTAPALVMANGNVLGQNELKHTSPTGEAMVELSKALDIEGEATESEVGRVIGAIKTQGGMRLYDLVTMQGRITLQNRLRESADMRITKTLTGLAQSASDDGQISFRPSSVAAVNHHSTIVWELPLASNQKKELTYRYEIYVRSP